MNLFSVFVEKCLEGNLLLEPEAQCFQCLHDVPSLCVELNLSKEPGTEGRFEGKDAHCKHQRALTQVARSHLRDNSAAHTTKHTKAKNRAPIWYAVIKQRSSNPLFCDRTNRESEVTTIAASVYTARNRNTAKST